MKLVKNKVVKLSSNSVQQVLNALVEDRSHIKSMMVVTLGKDGFYRFNRTVMTNEQQIAMCEFGKQCAINRMFGK